MAHCRLNKEKGKNKGRNKEGGIVDSDDYW